MSALDSLSKRLNYYGGKNQQDRMIKDKLRSLKKALLYSYQASPILLQDENGEFTREFLALINPDNLKPDYDNKILSIPYEDIQLNAERIGTTTEGTVPTAIKAGDVFYWVKGDKYCIIYLHCCDEKAYFRAEIRLCDKYVEINDHKYWVYYRGPVETKIPWNQKLGIVWNDPNYSAIIYITKNEETLEYFHRFKKIEIDGKPWEVMVVNDNNGQGTIEVQLKEDFSNTIEKQGLAEEKRKEELEKEQNQKEPDMAQIIGPNKVKPYDIIKYRILNADIEIGKWELNTQKAEISKVQDDYVIITILTGRSGKFNLIYNLDGEEKIVFPITIESL